MIRPLFHWLKRTRGEPAGDAQSDADGGEKIGSGEISGSRAKSGKSGKSRSGMEAGQREVRAVAALRDTVFVDREQAALHAQLARAPRDAGALFGLLQWHARRGEIEQVQSFAHALWDETDADGGLWQRAAAVGREVDPANPLYSADPFSALTQQAAAHGAGLPAPPAQLSGLSLDLSVAFEEAKPNDQRGAFGLSDTKTSPAGESMAVAGIAPGIGAGVGAGVAAGIMTDTAQSDWLAAQSAQLPASILALNLDLDDHAAHNAQGGRGKAPSEIPSNAPGITARRFYRPASSVGGKKPGSKQTRRKKPGK